MVKMVWFYWFFNRTNLIDCLSPVKEIFLWPIILKRKKEVEQLLFHIKTHSNRNSYSGAKLKSSKKLDQLQTEQTAGENFIIKKRKVIFIGNNAILLLIVSFQSLCTENLELYHVWVTGLYTGISCSAAQWRNRCQLKRMGFRDTSLGNKTKPVTYLELGSWWANVGNTTISLSKYPLMVVVGRSYYQIDRIEVYWEH